MDFDGEWTKKDWKSCSEDGVYVKGAGSFIVTDDLQVLPSTTIAILNVLDKLGIKEGSSLEQITRDFGAEEVNTCLTQLYMHFRLTYETLLIFFWKKR